MLNLSNTMEVDVGDIPVEVDRGNNTVEQDIHQ